MNVSNNFSNPAYGAAATGRTSASSYREGARFASSRPSVPILLVRHGENLTTGNRGDLTAVGESFAQNLSRRLESMRIDRVVTTSNADNGDVLRRNVNTVGNIPSTKGLSAVEVNDTNGIRRLLGECDGLALFCYNVESLTKTQGLINTAGEASYHPIGQFLNKFERTQTLDTETRGVARQLYHKVHQGEYDPSTGQINLASATEELGPPISDRPERSAPTVSHRAPVPRIDDLPRRRTFNFQQR